METKEKIDTQNYQEYAPFVETINQAEDFILKKIVECLKNEQPKGLTVGNVHESVVVNGNVGGSITNVHYHIQPQMADFIKMMKGAEL